MIEEIKLPTYEGLYRIENNSLTGLPNESDHRDFTFIRIKLPKKIFLIFNKHVNCLPIEMPIDFNLPPYKYKYRKGSDNPRLFHIKFEGELFEKVWTTRLPNSFRSIIQYSYQNIRITKIHKLEEI